MRLIVGISGSSGVIYGIRILQMLADHEDVETHLIMTRAARLTVGLETDFSVEDVESFANVVHNNKNIGASIASGSFKTAGMIIAPCSMKTLSGIANSYDDNLVIRAADVVLKERRRLVLLPRETPLHTGHCKLLHKVSRLGAIVCPPAPAFYPRPESIEELIDYTAARALDLFDIEVGDIKRWEGNTAEK